MFQLNDYLCYVSFVENDEEIFLKTITPSRKLKRWRNKAGAMKRREPIEVIDKQTKRVVAIVYPTHQETIVHRVKNRKSDIVIEDLKSTIEKAQYENLKK